MLRYLKSKLTGFNNPCGGGSSGGGGGSSTTVQEIPAELKPLATKYASIATQLPDTPYTPYSGQRYADLNEMQDAGIGGILNQALGSGNDIYSQASQGLSSMMGGGQNPYLDQTVNQALGKVQGNVNSQFGGSNYGTTANQDVMARAMGDTAASMYSNAYETDMNRRLQAIGMAPQISDLGYQGADRLMQAGQIIQDQNQQNLDFDYQQFVEAQDKKYKDLAAMAGVFGTNLGGTSKTESTSSGGGGK